MNGAGKAKTALQEIEARIRRLFGGVGDIGLTWQPQLTPVVIAGDLTGGGSQSLRGRRFGFGEWKPSANPATSTTVNTIRFQVDCVVTHLFGEAAAGAGGIMLRFGLFGPGDAVDSTPIDAPSGRWLEGSVVNEPAPILVGSGGSIATANPGNIIALARAGPGALRISNAEVFVRAGGCLAFEYTTTVAPTDIAWFIWAKPY